MISMQIVGGFVVGLSTCLTVYLGLYNLRKKQEEDYRKQIEEVKQTEDSRYNKMNENFLEIIKQLTILNEYMKASTERADNHKIAINKLEKTTNNHSVRLEVIENKLKKDKV